MTELPMACSLTAAQLPGRLAEMADLGRTALLEARCDGSHAQLRFAPGAGVHARVDAIVAAESQCCAFLAMRVRERADEVVLAIDAPAGAELVLGGLVDAFTATRAGAS